MPERKVASCARGEGQRPRELGAAQTGGGHGGALFGWADGAAADLDPRRRPTLQPPQHGVDLVGKEDLDGLSKALASNVLEKHLRTLGALIVLLLVEALIELGEAPLGAE